MRELFCTTTCLAFNFFMVHIYSNHVNRISHGSILLCTHNKLEMFMFMFPYYSGIRYDQ